MGNRLETAKSTEDVRLVVSSEELSLPMSPLVQLGFSSDER